MILVAGGTGHLGGEAIPRLMARRPRVRILTRAPARARRRLGSSPEFVEGDVRNPDSLEIAMRGIDAVVSAITGFGPGGDGPRSVDFEGNRNLIRVAEAAGVDRFVLLSMRGAAAGHPMELARMKHRAEEALRASRLTWTIVRPTPVMELWADLVGMIQAGIGFDTGEMRFDATEMHRRFPTIELTRMADVVGLRFGRTGRVSNGA